MSRHTLLAMHRWFLAHLRWMILIAFVAISVPLFVIWYRRTHVVYY